MTDYPIIWTADQVVALNQWQACSWVHPFTCGSDHRMDAIHRHFARPGTEPGQLVATRRGWVCPGCDYVQFWAHDFMFNGPPSHPVAAFHGRAEDGHR